MILTALLSARSWFTALPRGLKVALAAFAVMALLGVVWAIWLGNHDSAVIERHEDKREAAAAGATVKSAEERAVDALANQMARDQREAAIAVAEASEAAKAPEARATVAPQNRALNCARLKQAGLTGDAAYRDKCL